MKVIIPASGTGERFKNAGYGAFKALLKVNDKLVIDHIIDSLSLEDEFFVISSNETYFEMDKYLNNKHKQTGLKYHHIMYTGPKNGPVGAIQFTPVLKEMIKESEEVLISYCDFGFEWDYEHFKDFIHRTGCDGAIPCYTGYHPHLEDENNVYAACKHIDGDVYEVIEKYKSDDRFNEHWSAGLYYFSSFGLMSQAFQEMIDAKDTLNSEYYVSKAYNHIIQNEVYTVLSYPYIDKFYQFGTPKDFEYAKAKLENLDCDNNECEIENTIVLSAGKGERFLSYFTHPKPFLPLRNKPLVMNIKETFKNVKTNITFVASDAHKIFWESLKHENVSYVVSNKIGAAYSYKSACSEITGETLIVPCDLIAKHITKEFLQIKENADVVIFTSEPSKFNIDNAQSFAWVYGSANKVKDIGIKNRLSLDLTENVLIGSFWVKDNAVLLNHINQIFEKEFTVNGEYYLDNAFKNMVESGLNVKFINLSNYYSFGTPSEYFENKYWYELKD